MIEDEVTETNKDYILSRFIHLYTSDELKQRERSNKQHYKTGEQFCGSMTQKDGTP